MRPPRLPPHLLEWVLRAFVPPGAAGLSIVGDLREEFAIRGARSHLAATLWFAWQTIHVSYRLSGERRRARRADTRTRVRSKGEPVSSLLRDLRQGARSLMRTPVYAGTAILTLAQGVGATTAVFSVVNGVLLRPLPYLDPAALVDISVNTGGAGWYGSSIPEFFDYEENLGTVGHLAGWQTGLLTVGDSTRPRRIDIAFVTQQFFPALGVPPVLATVLRESLALTMLGALIGIPAGAVLTRATGRLVFGVGPFDMVSLSAALVVLAMSGVVSAAVPALRASRIDPIIALRSSG